MIDEKLTVPKKTNLDSLVLLRGIAVLLVCLCHFATAFWGKNTFFEYGKYGVQIFFVISGFVIPLSLQKGGFTWSDYPKFILKRIIRLYPPYLAALALTFIVLFIKAKVHHTAFPESSADVVRSIFYLYIPADNPVFWTLIVEGQYYIFIGCFFILFSSYPKLTSLVLLPCLLVISQTDLLNNIVFLHFIVFFFIGNVGFLIFKGVGSYSLNYCVLLLLLIYTAIFYSNPEFVSAFLTILFILLVKHPLPSVCHTTGRISYSIYLIHYPLGLIIINLLGRILKGKDHIWLIFVITIVLTFIISWIFYKVFEEHCETLSKKVKYITASNKKTISK